MIFESFLELRSLLTGRHPSESGWGGFWGGAEPSATGLEITPFTALSNSAFYQAVNLKSTLLATIAVHVRRRNAQGYFERAYGERLYDMLRYQPNREATAFTHQQTQYLNKFLWGNMYAEIEFDSTGTPVALWHLPSWLVTPHRVYKKLGGGLTTTLTSSTPEDRKRGGTILYEVRDAQGGKPVWLAPHQMKHVPGLSFNGLRGFSCISVAAESIAVGIAIQKSAASIFGNAAEPGAVLERPADAAPLTPTGERNLIVAWESQHRGPRKAGRVAVLQEGTAYKPVQAPVKELRLIEAYKNNVPEVARITNMPAYFLSWEGGASTPYSNVEQEWTRLVRQTLQPETEADEQEIRRKMISVEDAPTLAAEYELKTLLKGDSAGRGSFYQVLYNVRAITNGEIARLEGLPPVPAEEDGYKPADAPAPEAPPDPPLKQDGTPKAEPPDDERAALYAAPLRNLLAESMRRGVTREVREIRRAVDRIAADGKLSEFLSWAEREYRDVMPGFLAELVAPALGEEHARRYAESHAKRHLTELREALITGEPKKIVALLDAWGSSSATEAAEREIALLTKRLTAN